MDKASHTSCRKLTSPFYHLSPSLPPSLPQCGKPFLAHSTCGTCRENKEVEFMTLKVKGQSFMIHQIRKMVGKNNDN